MKHNQFPKKKKNTLKTQFTGYSVTPPTETTDWRVTHTTAQIDDPTEHMTTVNPSEEEQRLAEEHEHRRIEQEIEERRDRERAEQDRAQQLFVEEQQRQLEIANQERRKQEIAEQHSHDLARQQEELERRNQDRLAEDRVHQELLDRQRHIEQERREQERLDYERLAKERAHQQQVDQERQAYEQKENERRESDRREDERREHERRNEMKPTTTKAHDSQPTDDPYRAIYENEPSTPGYGPEIVEQKKCRADDTVKCSENRHVEICEVQLCDGQNDCPSGEDEWNCPESNNFITFFSVLYNISIDFQILPFLKRTEFERN